MWTLCLPESKSVPEIVLQPTDGLVQDSRLLPHLLEHVAVGFGQARPLLLPANTLTARLPVSRQVFVVPVTKVQFNKR
jgi:hypothetical protein